MNPKFSIIIPAYNVEKYISKCIQSILTQKFNNYEIIVVNDASTDNTLNELEKYKDKIIVINHEINKGAGGARNTAIRKAKGEYLVLLDSDDYLYNAESLDNLDKIIGNSSVDIVYTGVKIIGKKNLVVIPTMENSTTEYKIGKDKYYIEGSKCFRREFLINNNIWYEENRLYEDVLFNCKAIIKAKKHLIADFPLYVYLKGRENSNTTKITYRNIEDNIYNIKELTKLMENIHDEELKASIKMRVKRELVRCQERIGEILENIEKK